LVEFTECIDKIVIEYGTGSNSPTQHPTYSKITIGESIFTIEQCKASCDCLDSDEDGVCNDADICEGGNDNDDFDGDGIPNFCDDDCDNSIGSGDDDADGICNNEDECPGFDDNIDENKNGLPDGCDLFRLGVDFDLGIYPNPATAGSIIGISVTGDYKDADLLIFDEVGRLIEQSKLHLSDGTNTYQLSPDLISTGIYFVKIRTEAFNSKVHKLIIID